MAEDSKLAVKLFVRGLDNFDVTAVNQATAVLGGVGRRLQTEDVPKFVELR